MGEHSAHLLQLRLRDNLRQPAFLRWLQAGNGDACADIDEAYRRYAAEQLLSCAIGGLPPAQTIEHAHQSVHAPRLPSCTSWPPVYPDAPTALPPPPWAWSPQRGTDQSWPWTPWAAAGPHNSPPHPPYSAPGQSPPFLVLPARPTAPCLPTSRPSPPAHGSPLEPRPAPAQPALEPREAPARPASHARPPVLPSPPPASPVDRPPATPATPVGWHDAYKSMWAARLLTNPVGWHDAYKSMWAARRLSISPRMPSLRHLPLPPARPFPASRTPSSQHPSRTT